MKRAGFSHESAHNETAEWYTPPLVFERLGLTFDLDPASPGALTVPWVPAAVHLTKSHDGLRAPWAGRVWCNPPYGTETHKWVGRFIRSACSGVMLVFARTDASWFHDYAVYADALCFIRGRLRFLRPDGTPGDSAGAGSLLLAKGPDCVEALRRSGLGFVVPGRTD